MTRNDTDRSGASRWGWILAALGLVLFLAGCKAKIYHGLSERQANQLIVALEKEGVQADKQKDPAGENKWVVTVPSGEKVRAWQILEGKGLPRQDVSGFSEYYPSGGLIPTASEERILLQYATAQELRKTLLKINRVVDAHVNLVLPEEPRVKLEGTEVEPPRASVLVKYRPGEDGESAPMSKEEIKALVAGGVEGLEGENVEVQLSKSSQDLMADVEEPDTASVGPVTVAKRSKTMLQTVIGVMGAIIVLLGAGIVFLLWRQMGGND